MLKLERLKVAQAFAHFKATYALDNLRNKFYLTLILKMKKLRILFLLLIVSCIQLSAQTGTIRGVVTDGSNGEPIMFGNVFILDISDGTTTDLDGAYSINVAPGTYTMEFSYIGYKSTKVTEVKIVDGEVTIIDISLGTDAQILEEVVVTAEQTRNTEAALATIQRKSLNVINGISSQSFKKIGDSDAAGAIKRVTGVSVEGGKYVYVRGLGDRYTKSILNGMEIPGLDPDRNSLQMDIFPTNILDNIIVLKTFTADLPADFTGGVVDIQTKEFPETKKISINGSVGYNPNMHFNSNFRTYEGGSTDWLGFDDGTRDIPTGRSLDIPFRSQAIADPQGVGQRYSAIVNNFNPIMAAALGRSFMDYSIGGSIGDQMSVGTNRTIGYNVAVSYKNKTTLYENAEYNRFGKANSFDVFALDQREQQIGDVGINEILTSVMGGISYKTLNNKYIFNILRLQNGESKAGQFAYTSTNQGANFTAAQDNLEYSQRTITNALIRGTHAFTEGKSEVEWSFAPTLSSIIDPDIRFVRFRTDGGNPIGTEVGLPERIWRYLDEVNLNGKAHYQRSFNLFNKDAKIKAGGNYLTKTRDYEIQGFQIRTNNEKLDEDPNDIFLEENLWSPENLSGTTFDPTFIPNNPNKFSSTVNNVAGFVSTELEPVKDLKAVIGVRFEKYTQSYTGTNQAGDVFDNERVLDNNNLFPTANFIYALTDRMNLRMSYARTVARPSFKEASFATIRDPLSGRTFIGSFFPDINVSTGEVVWDGQLKQTDIDNIDLRWEQFGLGGQMISISGFYKSFVNPIEIVQYIQAANNFQPRNVGNGRVLGGEIELVQGLEKITPVLGNFFFNANVTVVSSKIDMSETEFLSRQENARTGEEVNNTRQMAGQAPYIINSGLSYKTDDRNFEAGIFYNVQGRTLRYVGIADRPDVYSVPFHSLNLNANYTFGNDGEYSVGLKATNVLNQDKEEVFSSFMASDQTFTRLRPQTSFSVKFGYTIK